MRSPSMTEDTVFDKILRGEIPSQKVYEDDAVFAFRDIHPQAPTHVLVIPKKKMTGFVSLADAEESAVGSFFKGVARVAKQLGLDNNGYRVVVNQGKDGGQTVEYIHAHILGGKSLGGFPK
jgi:histidine triad (HIT) family protein